MGIWILRPSPFSFWVADTQLYKRLCLSVRWSINPLVRPSSSMSRKVEKRAYPPLPTRPQLVAVYQALLLFSFIFRFCFAKNISSVMQIRIRGNISVCLSSSYKAGSWLGLPQLSFDPLSLRFTILIGRKSEQKLEWNTTLLCQSNCLPLSVSYCLSPFVYLRQFVSLFFCQPVSVFLSVGISASQPASISS